MNDSTMGLQLSCIPVSYFPKIINGEMSIASWIKQAAALGLSFVDVSLHFFPKLDRKSRIEETVLALEKHDMNVAVFNTYSNLLNPDAVERKKEIDTLLDGISVAASLGSRWVRVVAGQAYPNVEKSMGIQRVVDGFQAALERADKENVGLVFENHSKPGNWNYPDFAFNPEIFIELTEKLPKSEHNAIQVLFDTANAVAAGINPLYLLEKFFSRTVCIHAADTAEIGMFLPCPIGQGAVPFKEIFSFLIERKFSGIISIEEASFHGETGMRDAVQFIKNTWQTCRKNKSEQAI